MLKTEKREAGGTMFLACYKIHHPEKKISALPDKA